jgi:hypothetical protein|tara:strand:+ start:14 stop:409 length:396 start_codon:yes stop_codon:yes gene_type:complete
MKRILDLFFSDNPEFTIKFVVSMITAIALLMVSLGAQTTFTDEEMINLENDFIYLENKVDSLTYQDSLKAIMITTLEEEIKLTNEQLALTEKKVKLVKPSWYENKWLYFGYGSVLSYAVITLINQTGKIIG